MKRKYLTTLALVALGLSTNTLANTIEFETSDNRLETQACYTAATKGLDAAKQLVSKQGLSFTKFKSHVSCNGESLIEFAKRYTKSSVITTAPKKVQVVAENNDRESKMCLEALSLGVSKVESKYKVNSQYIRCNGIPLPKFVSKYRNNQIRN